MLFLAQSLPSPWKLYFLVRIHCSVYTINFLLAANFMCSCEHRIYSTVSSRLQSFFHHFMRPVTSLGDQGDKEFSERGPNFLNYAQHIFQGGRKIL